MKRKQVEKVDTTKYVGQQTTIQNAEIVETRFGKALKVETPELEENTGIKASTMFSFGHDEEEGYFIVEDGKLDKFLKSKGVDPEQIPDQVEKGVVVYPLIGLSAVVQKNTKNGYLEIAY